MSHINRLYEPTNLDPVGGRILSRFMFSTLQLVGSRAHDHRSMATSPQQERGESHHRHACQPGIPILHCHVFNF